MIPHENEPASACAAESDEEFGGFDDQLSHAAQVSSVIFS